MNNDINILITGDFYAGGRIDNLILDEKYDEIFNDFLPVIQRADLAITNLESPLLVNGNSIQKTGPAMKGSPKAINALDYAGFKLLTLANNHMMDFGEEGLLNTINVCDKYSVGHVGAGQNYFEASKVYYKEIKGSRIAVINFAENEFSTTLGDYPGCNPLDPVQNFNDIQKATKEADYVIVIVHGGHEMYELPSPRMKKLYHFFADAGATAVISHHTHCYSGYEVYNGVPIFYSLGNFIFDKQVSPKSVWNYGFAVLLKLGNGIGFSIIPYEQCDAKVGVRHLDSLAEKVFREKIEYLNATIRDDDLLNSEFKTYCRKVKKMYFSYLEPHSIRLLHFLRNRGIIPSIFTKRKRLLYLNLIRCESHRDVLLKILDNVR